MKNLVILNFRGHEIREITDHQGDPWFVTRDICEVLEIDQPTRAVQRLDDDEVNSIHLTDSVGRKQNTLIVNESGLYSLILGSRKPEAHDFKRWVTHEVIPQIRKTGSYTIDTPERLIARALIEANRLLEEQKPAVAAYDHFICAQNLQTWNTVAKSIGTGRNTLTRFLRERSILMSNNLPYQQYINRGFFVVKERPLEMGDISKNYAQTYVTARGVDYVAKRWREAHVLQVVK